MKAMARFRLVSAVTNAWRFLADTFVDRVPDHVRTWAWRFLKEWALTVAVGVLALLACAKLFEDVFQHETGTFDGAIQSWVLDHQLRQVVPVVLAITHAGSVPVMVGVALLGSLWLWRRRNRRVAAGALLAPAVATALFIVIKQIFARPRPALAAHLALSTYAFPSGHATASTAVSCTLAYIYWREGFISRRSGIALATIPPFLIGLSRVYLDVHWMTDVLGGWSLGLLIAVLGAALYDRNRRREEAAASLEGHATANASPVRQNA